jgi:hypothetical protein
LLPANGGPLTLDTDNLDKIITPVVSMARPCERDRAFDASTKVNRHRRPELSLNRMPGKVEFEDMKPLGVHEREPSQCVVLVHTFNSRHCMRPMQGQGSKTMRRSLAINVEHEHCASRSGDRSVTPNRAAAAAPRRPRQGVSPAIPCP